MKYIIMCGGTYPIWSKPRQVLKVNGEAIVERTIRLLRSNGIDDISISTNDKRFKEFGVPLLGHENNFVGYSNIGTWVDGFYPTDEPVCYLLGDVVFSDEAIKTIVETKTDRVEFFASAPPFADNYIKPYAEPFAFKVVDLKWFWQSIRLVKHFEANHLFNRRPIAWELWQVITGAELNRIDYNSYTVINDYTCDVDEIADLKMIEQAMRGELWVRH